MLERLKDKFKKKCDEISELEKCLSDKDYMEKKFGKKKENKAFAEINRTELIRRARAFSEEEWNIIINEAPIELCHERIGRELKEAVEFRKSVGAAVENIKAEEVW